MVFWTVICAMLAIAVLSLLVPLARGRKQSDETYFHRYKERLLELDALLAANPTDEVLKEQRHAAARRLLRAETAAKSGPDAGSNRLHTLLAVGAVVFVPVIALGLYSSLGESGRPDVPLSAQLEETGSEATMQSMLARVERHLKAKPDDAEGWSILERVYASSGEHMKRQAALLELIRLQGRKPDLLTNLAEARIQQDGNLVPASARALLDEALAQEPNHQKAAYYRTIAMEQSGQMDAALQSWTRLRTVQPDDAEWQKLVNQRIARLQGNIGPSEEQQEMIDGMVASLRAKLLDDPSDLDGWERLVRSYKVLNRRSDALSALASALERPDLAPAVRQRLLAYRADLKETNQ